MPELRLSRHMPGLGRVKVFDYSIASKKGAAVSKMVVMEEFHVTVFVPADLPKQRAAGIKRALRSRSFESRLFDAADNVRRAYPSLALARIRVSK